MLQFVYSARAGAVQKTKQVLKHDICFRVCFLFEMWLADGSDRRAESALEAKQSSRSEFFGGCCFEYAAKIYAGLSGASLYVRMSSHFFHGEFVDPYLLRRVLSISSSDTISSGEHQDYRERCHKLARQRNLRQLAS